MATGGRSQATDDPRPFSAAERYDQFIRAVVRSEQAWGLAGDAWAVMSDHRRTNALALWPTAEDAAVCATGEWHSHSPLPISLRALLHQLLPALEDEGLWVLVFPTPSALGVLVTPDALGKELEEARTNRR